MRWLGWAVTGFLLLWMLWDIIASDHGYGVYRAEHAEVVRLQQQLQVLKKQREQLAGEILRLRKDPKALEDLVHRELGYVYPDEYMLIVPAKKEKELADE
ncbi:MAG: septum formation initiator family protein [Mariprofundaceae bacterium]|nr:septum formation initiator family protein [Mariprofundaceae bacterium]